MQISEMCTAAERAKCPATSPRMTCDGGSTECVTNTLCAVSRECYGCPAVTFVNGGAIKPNPLTKGQSGTPTCTTPGTKPYCKLTNTTYTDCSAEGSIKCGTDQVAKLNYPTVYCIAASRKCEHILVVFERN